MAQLFPRGSNAFARISIVVVLVVVGTGLTILLNTNRLHYTTDVQVAKKQPVPFSHKHHVTGVGLDCRYCHTSVEESSFANIPPVETCMTCHSQIWTESPLLEPIRESYRTGNPIEWVRVHDLPDFVYFNHSIHVHKGIGCQTCHGQVDQMPLMWKVNTLNMEWCLECHREPEKYVRPREEVFNMAWKPMDERGHTVSQALLGAQLIQDYDINPSTDCSTCHR
ncbi:MAG: cytochrome c3 family protein [Gemmatimonadetes bacterium]|nr:cytochrome c3 family protein [Gemmatimonadota bacterium]